MAATRRKTRRQPTDAEKRERAERDARVSAEADRVLSDPDQVAQLVGRLLTSGLGPNVLGYTLRNATLIVTQCQDRGIPLSDVYGKWGWNARGRMVKGPGLRIVKPVGGGDRDEAEPEPIAAAAGPGVEIEVYGSPGDGEDAKPPLFRMTSVWDRSQTVDADWEAREEDDTTPVADAARVLLDNVTGQLHRRGYTIVVDPVDAPPRPSQIDHDAGTVAVSEDWPPRDRLLTLVLGLAQVLTRAAEARQARRRTSG